MFGGIAAADAERLVYATARGTVLTLDTENGGVVSQFSLFPSSPPDVHVSACAVDRGGDILLADTRNSRVRRFDAGGRQLFLYGARHTPGMTQQDEAGILSEPCAILPLDIGLLVGSGGFDMEHGLQRFKTDGAYEVSLAAPDRGWLRAHGLTLVDDVVWVAETEAGAIRRFALDGRRLDDVDLPQALRRPFRLAEDGYGRVLLLAAPATEDEQQLFGVARVKSDGALSGWAVEAGERAGEVCCPFDVAVLPDGRFAVADLPLGSPPDIRIQLFSADGRLLRTLMEDRLDLDSVQRAWFDSVLETGDGSAPALYDQARVHHYYSGGSPEHLEQARELYRSALEREPHFHLARLGLGTLLQLRLADPEGAEEQYRLAISGGGATGDLLARIAQCRHDRGDLDGAIEILREAVEGPQPPEEYHARLEDLGSYLLERAGEPPEPMI